MNKFNFTDTEKNKITEVVKELESKTSGEIVPYFVKQCDNYYGVMFAPAFFVTILYVLAVNVLSLLWLLPVKFAILPYSLVYLALMIISFAAPFFSAKLRILIVPEKREIIMVQKRAMEAFLTEEVFKTKDRTGILIFISELEKNVTIIADKGINQKVKQEQWQSIVNKLTIGIKKKDTANALVSAIGECRELLLNAGFVKKEDDTDELSNDINFKQA